MNQMLEVYAETLSPASRRSYRQAAKRFLRFSGGSLDRDRLLAYVRHLQAQGYSPNTIRRFDLVAVRGLFRASGNPWPLKSWELPTVSERDVFAPALHPDLIVGMVTAVKSGRVTREDGALVALAVTYGLRRIELAGMTPDDLDPERGLLTVRTAKRGRERVHLVPEIIAPYLAHLGRPLTPRDVSAVYYRVESAAGIPRMAEVGWHAIRRSLTRGLLQAGVPEAAVRNFMRWKRSEGDMLLRYFSTTVVGQDSRYLDPGREDREVDEAVFRSHPFLPMWGDDRAP
jgi:integrase